MMRSLRFRLTLAFLVVGLLGVAVGAIVASQRASGAFQEFTFARNQEGLVTSLASYYERNGSWSGFADSFPGAGLGGPGGPPIPLREPRMILVAGADGRLLAGAPGYLPGEAIPADLLADATPIESGGITVGWLVLPEDAFARTRGEERFLGQLNSALIFGSLGAAVLSLILGTLLARSLTRPLQALTEATRAVADGDLQRQVEVQSRDEVGVLAESFNRMSAALDRSQRLRRQMTADIAHDLRTPLSIIVGHLDAVDEGVLPADTKTINIMRDEAMHLSHMIEDLRTLSLADAGELSLARSSVDPGLWIRRCATAHQPAAQAAGIELAVTLEPGLPAALNLDPDRMSQVLGNLIDNALLHTPKGGRIQLSAQPVGEGMEIRVRDSGPGIPRDELELVFERTHRSDKSRQRNSGGSGLGLAIAKSIVEAHGGMIRAESTPDAGTTIIVTLPGNAASATAEA
jgi:signal transduction histidine kinase